MCFSSVFSCVKFMSSSVHGVAQARILEWVTIPFSGDLLDPGIDPGSPELQADSLLSEPPEEPHVLF